jgi:hypothetical protein
VRHLAAALLASATLAQGAGATPAPPGIIQSVYRVSLAGLDVGRVNETYERKGDRYVIQSVARTEGLAKLLDENVVRESTGRVVASGLQPLAFDQKRAGHGDRDIRATFDWERGVMASTYKGEVVEVPLPRDTQDPLSLMYQFMNIGSAATVSVPMANGRKVDLYTYRLVGPERIRTPAGEFDTLHYERVLSAPKETRAEVWVARDRWNLPVRVRYDDSKGLKWEQLIVVLETR